MLLLNSSSVILPFLSLSMSSKKRSASVRDPVVWVAGGAVVPSADSAELAATAAVVVATTAGAGALGGVDVMAGGVDREEELAGSCCGVRNPSWFRSSLRKVA